jgi:hypothetical protein
MHSVTDCFTEVSSWSLSSLVIAKYFKIKGTIISIFNDRYYHDIKAFYFKKHMLANISCVSEPWTIRLDEV